MKSKTSKLLHEVAGKPMLSYAVSAAAALERRAVANMAPAGHAYAALPQTATFAPLSRALGALLLAAAAALFLRRGRRSA